MVSALESGSSGSSAGLGHCVVLLGKKHKAQFRHRIKSLFSRVECNSSRRNLAGIT